MAEQMEQGAGYSQGRIEPDSDEDVTDLSDTAVGQQPLEIPLLDRETVPEQDRHGTENQEETEENFRGAHDVIKEADKRIDAERLDEDSGEHG